MPSIFVSVLYLECLLYSMHNLEVNVCSVTTDCSYTNKECVHHIRIPERFVVRLMMTAVTTVGQCVCLSLYFHV